MDSLIGQKLYLRIWLAVVAAVAVLASVMSERLAVTTLPTWLTAMAAPKAAVPPADTLPASELTEARSSAFTSNDLQQAVRAQFARSAPKDMAVIVSPAQNEIARMAELGLDIEPQEQVLVRIRLMEHQQQYHNGVQVDHVADCF